MSRARDQLALLVNNLPGIPKPEAEYQFLDDRKFRADWAWPDRRILLEYEGLFSAKSRHTTLSGYTRDALKYSLAAIAGWCVIRVTAPMVDDGSAALLIEAAHDREKHHATTPPTF